MADPKFPAAYASWIAELKAKVRRVQIKAAVSVNRELLAFYWELGGDILEQQVAVNWGDGFLSRLSKDLMRDFPEIKGFSKRNLELIRQWRRFWEPHFTIAKQPVSQLLDIPWGHHIALISKCGTIDEALFYAQSTVVHA
jgi:predicted nuclease of restriction endonuclease-like (RecB) superfamily